MTISWVLIGTIALDLLIRVTAIIVVPPNRRPTSGMAWLMAIFFIPVIGIIAFLLIGSPKLPKKRRQTQREINQVIEQTLAAHPEPTPAGEPHWLDSLVTMNTKLGALPLTEGNEAELIGDYDETLARMTAEVDTATVYVHVQFYILVFDEATASFFAAMERAVRRGVRVNVLMDHWACSRKPFYRETQAKLTEIGVEWQLMLPLQPLKGKLQRPDLRNHRKILVVDGVAAYLGSLNLTHRSYNLPKNLKRGLKWQELVSRVTGPAVLTADAVFLSDWYSETGEVLDTPMIRAIENPTADALAENPAGPGTLDAQVLPSGPGFDSENNLRLFLGLLHGAQKRIVITSPYFVPDESILYAITSAVARGVPVDLFVSEIGDQALVYHAQRSYYEQLLRHGVRIYLYPAPYILHAKHFSIDDDVALIGSSNMDMRSFALNMEVSLLVRGESFVRQMRDVEDHYRDISRELTAEEWAKTGLWPRILDNLARLTSALQ